MLKKCIVWILVLTFLVLVIIPEPAFARAAGKYRNMTAEPLFIAGGVLLVFLLALVIVSSVSKTDKALDSSLSDEPIDKEQRSEISLNINDEIATPSRSEKYGKKDQNSKTLLNASDDSITPSGNVVVFKW